MGISDKPGAYVSLGDSMSIDDYAGGGGCGAASLLFRNRDDDFPDWRGRDFASKFPGATFVAAARDGATAGNVRYLQIPELKEKRDLNIALITLTMGGNDLLQSYGNNAAAREACQHLADNGSALLTELRACAGEETPILVSTIYDPSDGTGLTDALQIAPWPSALVWIEAYNDVLRRLASQFNAILVDTHAEFLGHGLKAGDPTAHYSRPENRNLYYCGIVEPNAWGASALRELWWNAIA